MNDLITKSKADDFISRLEDLEAQLYRKGSLEKKVEKLFTKEEVGQVLKAAKVGKLSELKDRLMNLPVLTLTVAFEPTVETVERISRWIEKNCQSQVLVDFLIDPRVIGGAVVEFEGKHKDYTVLRKVNEKF